MSVREYIGARYVPLFADPIEWDNTKSYEPLTIVYHQGNSYTSRQAVPSGIAITNEQYWALTGNYNAQIEAYRAEVQQFSDDIHDIEALLPSTDFSSENTVKDAIDALNTAFDSRLDDVEANGWVTSSRIASGAVTTGKIDSNAVTTAKIDDLAVTTTKINDMAVSTNKIADNAVTTDKIADNSITKSKIVNDDIFLIFGDSWCDFENFPDWSIEVNDILGCGEIKNYGEGGGCFVYDTNHLIASQITLANSELTAQEKANVKYIMIMAGVNDHHPFPANGLYTAIDNALTQCKQNYPNAIIQWFPTSCAPDYDNSNGPKWLHCQSTFWYVVGRRGAGSGYDERSNRFAFPSCGIGFYFNGNSAANQYFNSTKLHLNAYGLHAIVPAILEGYGKLNTPYCSGYHWGQGTGRMLSGEVTPQTFTIHGDFSSTSPATFSQNIGEKILLAMAYDKAEEMFVEHHNPSFVIFGCTDGNASLIDYVSVKPNSDFTNAVFEPRSQSSGVRYLFW